MQLSNHATGHLSMLMYVMMTVLSTILIHDTNQSISPFLSAFYTFSFCLFVYSYAIGGLFDKTSLVVGHWFKIAMLNLATAVCWVCSFLSLKLIPPELFLFIFICSMPVAYSLIYKVNIVRSLLFMCGLALLAMTYHVDNLYLGFILAFVGGSSGTLYSIFAKKLSADFTTMEILSLRFFLTVLITLMANIYFDSFKIMDSHFYLSVVFLSLVSVIFPLIFYQVGIKHLDVARVISYLPLAPMLCYALNLLIGHSQLHFSQFLAVMVMFLLMIFNFSRTKRES